VTNGVICIEEIWLELPSFQTLQLGHGLAYRITTRSMFYS